MLTFTQQAYLNGMGLGLVLGIVAGIVAGIAILSLVTEVKRINKEQLNK